MTEQVDISKIDTLNRDTYINNVKHVIEVLKNNGNGGSFAISAGWGYGKSFILKKLESELSSNEDFFVLRYDCWKYNYYEEPLMALLASMVDQLQDVDYIRDVLKTTVKAISYMLCESVLAISSAVSKMTLGGIDPVDAGRKAYNDVKKELNDFCLPDYDTNSSLRKSIDIMRGVLGKVALEKQLIIVIDELDRCLPAYQIKILERIHHLMDKQTSIIVYAINPEQLRETIRHIYGGDSEDRTAAYLKKFMDFQMPLTIGEMKSHIYNRYEKHFADFENIPIGKEYDDFFDAVAKIFSNCDARTVNKIWEKQYLLHHMVFGGNNNDARLSHKILCLELMILVTLQWARSVSGGGSFLISNNDIKVSPEMLLCSVKFNSKMNERNSIKTIQGLWQLWTDVASSLKYGSIRYYEEGERKVIQLPNKEMSLLEFIGVFWCNVSDNKYLKYTMGTKEFEANCYALGEFYKLACIIE